MTRLVCFSAWDYLWVVWKTVSIIIFNTYLFSLPIAHCFL